MPRLCVHFHNTFFYNKLYKGTGSYDFKAVSRRGPFWCARALARSPHRLSWTSEKRLGYKIMDCEVIVVPVHQDMHWVLAVIYMATKEVQYLDSLGGIDQVCLARTA